MFSCEHKKTEYVYNESGFYKIVSDGNKIIRTSRLSKDSVKSGEELLYFKSGNLKQRLSYKNGLRNGKDTIFYKSGNPHFVRKWFNDTLIHSEFVFFNETHGVVAKRELDTFIVNIPRIKKFIYHSYKNSNGRFVVDYVDDERQINGSPLINIYFLAGNNFLKVHIEIPMSPLLRVEVTIIDEDNNEVETKISRRYNEVIFKVPKNQSNSKNYTFKYELISREAVIYEFSRPILINSDIATSDPNL
jgi:hypothetical protein